MRSNKGITLVALVITIVVLLILAGVSLSLVLSDNGILTKAKDAKTNYTAAATEENQVMANALKDFNSMLSNAGL